MKKSILITFDSMKFPNTGLFYFDRSLGNALLAQNKTKLEFTFYTDKNSFNYFNQQVNALYETKLHKVFFNKYKMFNLVHFTDQYCRIKINRFKCPKILTIHDINQIHEDKLPTQKTRKHLIKLRENIAACDRIVAISNFVANEISTCFPEARKKLVVIYNGADKHFVNDAYLPAYLPKSPFLFTIGILSQKKNFHVLPALLKGNDYELIISGIETSYKNNILQEAQKYGCLDRVKITGTISDDDKAWYYKNCQAFIFPSLAEGFGLPVIEAMYFGKPVFLSRKTSLPEIGGNVAFYFDSFEAEHLQNVFIKGMNEFKEKKLSAKVIEHAQKFDWQKTAQQYIKLYHECLIEKCCS